MNDFSCQSICHSLVCFEKVRVRECAVFVDLEELFGSMEVVKSLIILC